MPDVKTTHALPRLLLIDDDAISREVLGMVLEVNGFPVTIAEDGAAALALLDSSDAEVILMDTQMPGLSGLELIAALRKQSKAQLVAISGSDPGVAIRRVTDGFLLKPIQAEDVVALLKDADKKAVPQKRAAGRDKLAAGSDKLAAAPGKSAENDLGGSLASTLRGPVIDPVVLGKLKAMMPAKALREIYEAVATDLAMRLVTLRTAMEAGDSAEVRRIAHAIKGGCAMVGLSGAMESAARLESSNVLVTLPVELSPELSQLHFALHALEGMLGEDFPA